MSRYTKLLGTLLHFSRHANARVTRIKVTKVKVAVSVVATTTFLLLSSVSSTSAFGPPVYVGPIPNTDAKHGRVMARAVVLDEDGNPILVEFNEQGDEVSPVNLGDVSVNDVAVVAAADYRFYINQLADYREQYADSLAIDAKVLSRVEYEQETFLAADNETTISQPPLPEGVHSVLVRGQVNRVSTNGSQLVLLSFPFDLSQNTQVSDNDLSIVINQQGQVVAQSTNTIGYRNGFFGDPEEAQDARGYTVDQEDTVFGPVAGVKVYVDDIVYRGGVDVSGQDGRYSFGFYMPTCPPGGFTFTTDVWAELRYKNFLPTGSPSIPYFLRTPGYSYCYASLVPALIAPSVIGIQATQATPFYQSNLFADVLFVSGRIAIFNNNGQPVPVGDTTYTVFDEPAESTIQNYYDFNGDGNYDTVLQGNIETQTDDSGNEIEVFVESEEGTHQGIFFDGTQNDEFDFPDLVRLIDQELRNEPIGVLKDISSDDMRNTDVLFFREATGQLIMERRGLKEEEADYRPAVEYDEENNEVGYRILLRGPYDHANNIGGGVDRRASYEEWATESQLTEPFKTREGDHPRPGETIKIVAINRATGYIGTQRVQLSPTAPGANGISIHSDPIIMRPPNLKVWAERNYEIEHGLTQGEERTYTISSEGAGLTSDKTITVYTEWLDHDGRPLPDELGLDNGEQYGLTGRLAKVVGSNQLQGEGAGSDLAEFPIKPGRQTQVINVGDNLSTAEHFYIHVIGKPKDQECVGGATCPNFTDPSQTAGLEGRPNLLTPFLVPLPNEDQTWQDYSNYRNILRNLDPETPDDQRPRAPLPAYAWQARPEYQFSQFELEVSDVSRNYLDDNESPAVVNILDSENPVITFGGDYLDIFYSLVSSNSEPLTPVDGEQQLVISVGANEQEITVASDGSITFDNLDGLSQLEAEDFLNIRVYSNNDTANVLWEMQLEGAQSIGLSRIISLARFNSSETSTGTIGDVTDSFLKLPIEIDKPSAVAIEVMDSDFDVLGTLVNRTELSAGVYGFILTFEDIGQYVSPNTSFYVAVNKLGLQDGKTTRTYFTGKTQVNIDSEMLGQVIEHDTLIQRGSLTLRREDIKLKGLGPQLDFIRSYSNESKLTNENSPMGPGWNHNHNIHLKVISRAEEGGVFDNNLPNWISPFRAFGKPIIVPYTSFPDLVQVPRVISVSNGGMFIFQDDEWRPSRGFHGSLSFEGDHYEYVSKDGTRYVFNSQISSQTDQRFLVNQIIDRNGNALSYDYERLRGRELVKSVVDETGRSLVFNYQYSDAARDFRLTSVASPETNINLNFTYSSIEDGQTSDPLNGSLMTFSRADFSESYDYEKSDEDNVANMVSRTDAVGNTTRYNYLAPEDVPDELLLTVKGVNKNDVIDNVSYPGGFGTGTIEYDFGAGNKRKVSDLNGNIKTYVLNDYGNPNEIQEPLGKTTKMVWTIDEGEDDVLVISREDAEGRVTAFEYDQKGNVTKQIDPIGTINQTWNQAFSLLEERTDREGTTTTYDYDSNGNLTTETDGDGFATRHTYNAKGLRLTTQHPANGGTSTYGYDQFGNLGSVTHPEGSKFEYSNDARGNVEGETDPNTNQTAYAYDALDRVTSITHPDGLTSSYTYDAKGNKKTETDKLSLTLTYEYDARDRVETVTRSFGGGSQSFSYDNQSNLINETDWKGQTTTHEYDALHRRTETINRDGKTMRMAYDLVNNLTSETDYRNNTTTHDYDAGDRLETTINAVGDTMSFTYDKANNVLTQTDYEGRVTQHEYNDRYLKTRTTNALNGVEQWAYDGRGNNTSYTDEENRITKYTYDKQNRQTSKQDALKYTSAYQYDDNGNVTKQIDRRGNEKTFSYDELNRLEDVIDEDGYNWRYTYDGNNNKTSERDGNGNTTTHNYDKLNRLTSTTTPVSGQITYQYDENNNLTEINDAISTVYRKAYDRLDRLTDETEAFGSDVARTKTTGYDENGNVTSVRDFRGNITTFQYDALNRLTTETDALSQTTSHTYDRVGNKRTTTDRRSNTTTYVYDDLNRVTTVSDALGQSIVTNYDAVDNPITETDKRGTTTTHSYDKLNRLLTSTKPDGSVTVRLIKNEYDGEGNVTDITDANNNLSKMAYNGRNLLTTTTNPDQTSSTINYDGAQNTVNQTDEAGETNTYTYDAANRQVTAQNAENELTRYSYDLNNNKTKVTQPLGNEISYEFDALNRLNKATDGAGNVTQYSYDGNNNQTSHTDANGNVVNYAYDVLNRRTAHYQPNGISTTFGYDPEGNMTSRIDPNGQTFTYAYDAINRQTTQSFPSVATPYMQVQSINTDYDDNNNPTQITETKLNALTGQTVVDTSDRQYDLLDRLTQDTQRGQAINYSYDDNGNRTSVSSASGNTSYTFDSRNRLLSAISSNGTSTYTYTPDSKKEKVTYPNGTQTRYAFDQADRVLSVVNERDLGLGNNQFEIISQFDYSYDDNSNRITQTETQNGFAQHQTQTTTYTYDTANRMTSYAITAQNTGDVQTLSYSYDNNYNRLTEVETLTVGGITTTEKDRTSSYDANNRLITITHNLDPENDTIDYVYDNNGNTLSKTDNTQVSINVTEFIYDSRNQLSQVTRGPPDSQSLQGRYDYNHKGLRVRHLSSERGDVEYLYDDQSILEERDLSNNTLLAHYRYSDRLISLSTASDEQYYHYSALRTTANLTNNAGQTQVSYRTDAWGQITDQQGTSPNRQIFTGQEHDENTGLIYFGARFYDPDTARFINEDTYLGESLTPPSLHRYLYAYGNPTVYIDPNGNVALQHVEDFFDEKAESARAYLESEGKGDGVLDYAKGAAVGLGAGLLEMGAGIANVGNFVENQAIELAGKAGLASDSLRSTAREQTDRDFEGLEQTAQGIKTLATSSEARSQFTQGIKDTYQGVKDGNLSDIGKMSGAFGQLGVGGPGLSSAAKATTVASTKAAQTVAVAAKQGAAKARLTIERAVKSGGNLIAKMKESAGKGSGTIRQSVPNAGGGSANKWNTFQRNTKGIFSNRAEASRAYREGFFPGSNQPFTLSYAKKFNAELKALGLNKFSRKRTLNALRDNFTDYSKVTIRKSNGNANFYRRWDGINAREVGAYGSTFNNSIRYARNRQAVRSDWNNLTNSSHFKIRKGGVYVDGPAAPKMQADGSILNGGGHQRLITDFDDLVK